MPKIFQFASFFIPEAPAAGVKVDVTPYTGDTSPHQPLRVMGADLPSEAPSGDKNRTDNLHVNGVNHKK